MDWRVKLDKLDCFTSPIPPSILVRWIWSFVYQDGHWNIYKTAVSIFLCHYEISFNKMKSKDIMKLILPKYNNGDSAKKISPDLKGALSCTTLFEWYRINTRSIRMSAALDSLRLIWIWTKEMTQKGTGLSTRKQIIELDFSRISMQRTLKDYLGCHKAYKKRCLARSI